MLHIAIATQRIPTLRDIFLSRGHENDDEQVTEQPTEQCKRHAAQRDASVHNRGNKHQLEIKVARQVQLIIVV
jgi:hypothetical protein